MSEYVAFDIETNGKLFWDPEFRVIMVCAFDGTHTKVWGKRNIPEAVVYLKESQEAGMKLVGHNGSAYDRPALYQLYGVNLKCHDTMLMAYLLDEQAGQHTKNGGLRLETLAMDYLKVAPWKDAVTWGWAETDTWDDDDPRWLNMRDYCIRDTTYTLHLLEEFIPKLKAHGLYKIYASLLLPASRALSNAFVRGVYINMDNIEAARSLFSEQLETTRAACQLAGIANPGSSKQLREYFYGTHGFTPVIYTKGSPTTAPKPSTNELALKTLALDADDPEMETTLKNVLAYREAQTMLSTFLNRYVGHVEDSLDGRVHPSYSLTTTVTGRTSSFSPNFQQIPRDVRVRRIVGASPGMKLLQADLSQVELRIAAHVFNERNMLAAFKRGDDLHMVTAEAITGKRKENISKEDRSHAKVVNFSLLYGAETQTFLNQAFKDYDLLLSFDTANGYRDSFFELWADLIPAYYQTHEEIMSQGFVTSLTGRRRRFPHYREAYGQDQVAQLREAINFKVQSFASDVALTLLVQLTGMGLPVTAFIHDAVQAEIMPHTVQEWMEVIPHTVQNTLPRLVQSKFGVTLNVPLLADVKVADNWGEIDDDKPVTVAGEPVLSA